MFFIDLGLGWNCLLCHQSINIPECYTSIYIHEKVCLYINHKSVYSQELSGTSIYFVFVFLV